MLQYYLTVINVYLEFIYFCLIYFYFIRAYVGFGYFISYFDRVCYFIVVGMMYYQQKKSIYFF